MTRLSRWLAFATAAFAIVSAPAAHAAPVTYNFAFGSAAAGQFTTDAAAADPGYFLVTSLNFTMLNGATGLLTGKDFQPGAAYNPTMSAFLNHYSGSTYEDIGLFYVTGSLGGNSFFEGIDGSDFRAGSPGVDIDGINYVGALVVTPVVPVVNAVPEPASMALVGIALLGVVGVRRTSRPA